MRALPKGLNVVFVALAAVLFSLAALTETTDFASPEDTLAFIAFGLASFAVGHLPL